ncbi:metallopeptidase family protein [Parvularcula sp. ZS-1/3]|uniref:Metallopeptidase family protein n=2 Tax=Parvularcula mediterranea TaxID=2732508 RepID=A0A7Y3RLB4_9PROT|nr:metallopeptidase family protein [Parvularcula mediterranea]
MADEAYLRLPERFRALTGDLVLRTPDYPEEDVLREFGMQSPYELLGLYQGVDLTRKSLFDASGLPDTVYLYRLPILRYWREGTDTLEEIVEHVLVHEIGHHFGFSDDDMHAIEDEAD